MLDIRGATLADLPGVYRVCLYTDNPSWPGEDLSRNPDVVGHVYVGPYVVGAPEFASVVADSQGIAGYVVGCPDTRAFYEWCEAEWWPLLRQQYPRGSGAAVDSWIVDQFHCSELLAAEILEEYPAHLHINLMPRTRGTGVGRRLMERFFDQLRVSGAPGVHLGVASANTNAIQFYEHMGFSTHAVQDTGRLMVKRLEPRALGVREPGAE